jgi:DNA invertase Pin-like site-specific DNA recombinase
LPRRALAAARAFLDAESTPAGKAMFQMLGVFAEFERAMIVERVQRGSAALGRSARGWAGPA